jgi:arginyl-tRNA synthetase
MVFDFELAKEVSMNNPVYYVQYAHARCRSLMRKAEELGQPWLGGAGAELGRLGAPEEKAIVRQMDRFGQVVVEIARAAEPMPMTAYLRDLATSFHAYFTAGNKDEGLRVIQAADPALTQARLTLIAALRQVLANGLDLLGVVPLDRL